MPSAHRKRIRQRRQQATVAAQIADITSTLNKIPNVSLNPEREPPDLDPRLRGLRDLTDLDSPDRIGGVHELDYRGCARQRGRKIDKYYQTLAHQGVSTQVSQQEREIDNILNNLPV